MELEIPATVRDVGTLRIEVLYTLISCSSRIFARLRLQSVCLDHHIHPVPFAHYSLVVVLISSPTHGSLMVHSFTHAFPTFTTLCSSRFTPLSLRLFPSHLYVSHLSSSHLTTSNFPNTGNPLSLNSLSMTFHRPTSFSLSTGVSLLPRINRFDGFCLASNPSVCDCRS